MLRFCVLYLTGHFDAMILVSVLSPKVTNTVRATVHKGWILRQLIMLQIIPRVHTHDKTFLC